MSAPVVAPPEPLDGEVVVVLDRTAAEKLDGRIRRLVGQVDDQRAQVRRLLDDARQGQIHQALGFSSWTAYVADVLSGTLELTGDSRREVVHLMADGGMSERAIADATGASKTTVHRDLEVVHNGPPDAGEHDERPTVTGLDGKTHPRHRPAPTPTTTTNRRRAPFPGHFSGGVAGLERIVNNLEKLTSDDRFRDFARSDAGAVTHGSLRRYIAALQAVADQFPDPDQAEGGAQ